MALRGDLGKVESGDFSGEVRGPALPGPQGRAGRVRALEGARDRQHAPPARRAPLHFGRRDLGRTCLAAGACSTTTGGETAALLPLMAMCRTPRALTSTHRRGVVRSRNQRGVARTGQEGAQGRERREEPYPTRNARHAHDRRKRRRQQATGMEESDDEPRKRQRRRRRTAPACP